MNIITGRLQRLPLEFWMPAGRSLYDKHFYVNIWEAPVKEHTLPTMYEEYKTANECILRIRELNSEKERFAFASGPVVCFGNQHSVFAFTGVKEGTKFLNKETKAFKLIRQAYNCLFNFADNIQKVGGLKTEIVCPKKTKINDKDDPKRIVIKVKYSEDNKETYSFRCRVWHTTGDFVCVYSRNKYVNVKVVDCEIMSESEIRALAAAIGYADIKEVYCDTAIDTPEAWANWTKTEEPEEEYQEDMTELQTMKEAFSPACDYVSHKPENVYDGENFDVCEDEDELPE